MSQTDLLQTQVDDIEVPFEDQDFNINIDLPPPPPAGPKPPALSSIVSNYDREKYAARYQMNKLRMRDEYHYEKVIGTRRVNGHKKLDKLTPAHERMIAAYVNGMSGVEIAAQFKCDALTVYRILGDPLAASLIAEVGEHFRDDFKQLFPLVYSAVRDGLESDSSKVKMAAIDRFQRIVGLIDGKDESGEVEKQQARVISARVTIVNMIKENAPKDLIEGQIIEGSALQSQTSEGVARLASGGQLALFDDLVDEVEALVDSI